MSWSGGDPVEVIRILNHEGMTAEHLNSREYDVDIECSEEP
jgi:hypothetical protein